MTVMTWFNVIGRASSLVVVMLGMEMCQLFWRGIQLIEK